MFRPSSQRLTRRLSVSVVVIEIVFMTVVGTIYFNRFAAQIDQRQVERLQIAAEMINQNRLNLTSLTDRDTMSLLLGEEIEDAMLITDKGIVAFSLSPEYRRMAVKDIPFLDKNDLSFDNPSPILKRVDIDGQPYLVSITSSPGTDKLAKLMLYFRTSVASAEREKANMVILLLAGFATTVVATSSTLTLVFNRTVLARVGKLALAARKVEAGDLTVRADSDGTSRWADDEIVVLQHGFNAMVERLQNFIGTLEQRVAERTGELILANQELRIAKEQADASNRAKSSFLANMSHELRTPLNAVLGFAQLMRNDPDATPVQKENLAIIMRNGEHLLNLINNVLELSKIEAGRVTLEETPLDLYQLVYGLRSLMQVRAKEKGLTITVEHAPDLPQIVNGDCGKLRQVLINLIGNAIKYTRIGGVALRVTVARWESSGRAHVRFEVTDTGPGIREEDRERIFFPFVQLGDQPPVEAGTGLGLAISKQYVDLMGGKIGVVGEPGKGSVFHFEIPVTVYPSDEMPVQPRAGRVMGLAEGQPRYRLLIVEDQPDGRLLLRRLLEPLGFEVREAANGQEAVALFELWHPEMILMDIRLPVMDGLEASRRIRSMACAGLSGTADGAGTVIVALTAHALEEERREILAAGCDGFLRKPFRETELFEAIERHLGVCFIYGEPDGEAGLHPPTSAVPIDVEMLAALPDELLSTLERGLAELDIDAVGRAIEDIRRRDASLGGALAAVAGEYRYGTLLHAIQGIRDGGRPEG